MDLIQINRFTQDSKVRQSRNALYDKKIYKTDALRLIVYACKKMYGINNTARLLHSIGVDKIDLSL